MTTEEVDALRALVLAQQRQLEHPIFDWFENNRFKATFDHKTRIFTIAYAKTNECLMHIRKNPRFPRECYQVEMRSRRYRQLRSAMLHLAIDVGRTHRYFALVTHDNYNNVYRAAISWTTTDGVWFSFDSSYFDSDDALGSERPLFRSEALEIFQQLEQAAMAWGMMEVTLKCQRKLVAISEIKSAKY